MVHSHYLPENQQVIVSHCAGEAEFPEPASGFGFTYPLNVQKNDADEDGMIVLDLQVIPIV